VTPKVGRQVFSELPSSVVQDEYSNKYRNVATVLVIAGLVLLFVVTGVVIVSRS